MLHDTFLPDYASTYDLVYLEKDYDLECGHLAGFLSVAEGGRVSSLLDLGCGTGEHAIRLAELGYEVVGVDRSEDMLRFARAKRPRGRAKQPSFVHAEMSSLALDRSFDAAVMMFNVIGYQTANQDVVEALQAAGRHLRPGGILVFDFWHGPGVLKVGPDARVKEIGAGDATLLRSSRGTLDIERQVCTVTIEIWTIRDGRLEGKVREDHPVRFFFPKELELLLDVAGFDIRLKASWPSIDVPMTDETWTAVVVAHKR